MILVVEHVILISVLRNINCSSGICCFRCAMSPVALRHKLCVVYFLFISDIMASLLQEPLCFWLVHHTWLTPQLFWFRWNLWYLITREFPTHPSRGVCPPAFAQHPPASGGNEGERGRGGRGKGEEKGRDPQGLVDTHPHVPNPEKYPVCNCICSQAYGNTRDFIRNIISSLIRPYSYCHETFTVR